MTSKQAKRILLRLAAGETLKMRVTFLFYPAFDEIWYTADTYALGEHSGKCWEEVIAKIKARQNDTVLSR
jgi:hypothetical protein